MHSLWRCIILNFAATACHDPPTPPAGSNLKSNHTAGELVPFGGKAHYFCQDVPTVNIYGAVTGTAKTYFKNDRSQAYFEAECLPTGNFYTPDVWPECVPSKKNAFGARMAFL